MTTVTPWWEALKLRSEIVTAAGAIDDVQMSLYDAVYSEGGARPKYSDPAYFGEITHPTGQLVDLLGKLAVRLGGGPDYVKAPALIRLDQGMGGGKSHACIGAWHLAKTPAEFARTDIGQAVRAHASRILGRELPADLDEPRVVVLPCDNMTPGAPVRRIDGPARNLWERFLWRLFAGDYARFEDYQPYFNDKSKVVDALRSVNHPVLIIVDEIMNYVGNGLDGAASPDLSAQDMGFLRVLLDAVNDVPHVAMLLVMIATDKDPLALSRDAAGRREELTALLDRNGRTATVNENADFAAILRRRLFDHPPAREVTAATAAQFAAVLSDRGWRRGVLDQLNASWLNNFADEVGRCYPFHPQLMHLAEVEWANLAGFQKVRSTIRVFAATIWSLQRRAAAGNWVPALVGPGDLPLSDTTVRESVLGSGLITDAKAQANYRSLTQNDIVSLDDAGGAARLLDLNRGNTVWVSDNPRAAERAATAIFLASIMGARGHGRRGASDPETKATTIVPSLNYGLGDADGVISDLTDADTGMAALEIIPGRGGQPKRYYLSTRQTLAMLARSARNSVSELDRDRVLADTAERLTVTGPFQRKLFVRAKPATSPLETLSTAGLDDARVTRLIVLDPAMFSLRNGMEADTLTALNAAFGLSKDGGVATWASSAVFAVVNTQRRAQARRLAVEYLAWDRTLEAPEVQADDALREKAVEERAEAKRRLEGMVRSAYQHVAYLAQPDADSPRSLGLITFEGDMQTSLDGGLVWKSLVEREKAFDAGEFTARAMLYQLRETDYGRPLSEIRDSFWQSPRLPLLHKGESDLRQALYEAVRSGSLRVVSRDGKEVAVTAVTEINLSASNLTIAGPAPFHEAAPVDDESPTPQGEPVIPSGDDASAADEPARAEQQLSFNLIQRLSGDADPDRIAAVFRALYEVIDRGAASYLQGTLRLIVDSSYADTLAQQAREAGINVTVTDQF